MRHFGLQLNALRAFEAAARRSSFSRAADELHVSHSTISHHIKGLEAALGVELFLRRNRRVELTGAGKILLPVLTRSFDRISATLESLKAGEQAALKVTVTPSFANKWLVPHLRYFREAHVGIDVQLKSSLSLADFRRDRFDVGVRSGPGQWPGLNAELLMPIHMTPLCSPRLLQEQGAINAPADLSEFTLLHADVNDNDGADAEWRQWLVAVGAAEVDSGRGLSFHDPGLALQAAVDGLGIAMGYIELAANDLAAGNLVRPFETVVKHPWSYFIVIPEHNLDDAQVQTFCDWLRAEVRGSLE